MHDLAIRNARICDGRGGDIFKGELAIKDHRISEVGPTVGAATEEIDAQEYVLSPGLIDNHTHYDAQLTWDPWASPTSSLGVTTLIMGNCGFTIAPCRQADREQTLKSLTQVEGMSLEALLTGTHKGYETFGEYMSLLESCGMVPNVAVYCGHSSVRTWVMGEGATQRVASADEIEQMKTLIREAMDLGAIGFSTSTYQGHNGWGGVPMPSRFASDEELRELVNTLGESDRGCFMLTKGMDTSVEFLESIAASSNRPVIVAAIQYDHSNPDKAFNDMRDISAAVDRGRTMVGQVACTPISFEFTLRGAYLFESLESWRPAISLYQNTEELARLLGNVDFRDAVKKELVAPGALNRFTDQWDKFEVLEVVNEENKHLEQQFVADLAQKDGKHPLDWLLDFAASENFDTLFNAQILNADEDQVLKLLKDKNSSIGLADAGAHLFLFCDADYGLQLLGHWTRDRGDFTLSEAVAELTSKQATTYGIKSRGVLQAGYFADLLLFDPQTVGRGKKWRAHDLPANASRLVRDGNGIKGIWVNGTQTFDANGPREFAGWPGQLLREFN